jgi:hypothetical protein
MIPSQPLIEAENCQSVFGATQLFQDRRPFSPGVLVAVGNRDRDDFAAQNVERRLQPCNILVASRSSV